jgi:hypothetical protein
MPFFLYASNLLPYVRKCSNMQNFIRGCIYNKIIVFARKMQINAMFFVSINRGFLGVARKDAGLSNYEFEGNN